MLYGCSFVQATAGVLAAITQRCQQDGASSAAVDAALAATLSALQDMAEYEFSVANASAAQPALAAASQGSQARSAATGRDPLGGLVLPLLAGLLWLDVGLLSWHVRREAAAALLLLVSGHRKNMGHLMRMEPSFSRLFLEVLPHCGDHATQASLLEALYRASLYSRDPASLAARFLDGAALSAFRHLLTRDKQALHMDAELRALLHRYNTERGADASVLSLPYSRGAADIPGVLLPRSGHVDLGAAALSVSIHSQDGGNSDGSDDQLDPALLDVVYASEVARVVLGAAQDSAGRQGGVNAEVQLLALPASLHVQGVVAPDRLFSITLGFDAAGADRFARWMQQHGCRVGQQAGHCCELSQQQPARAHRAGCAPTASAALVGTASDTTKRVKISRGILPASYRPLTMTRSAHTPGSDHELLRRLGQARAASTGIASATVPARSSARGAAAPAQLPEAGGDLQGSPRRVPGCAPGLVANTPVAAAPASGAAGAAAFEDDDRADAHAHGAGLEDQHMPLNLADSLAAVLNEEPGRQEEGLLGDAAAAGLHLQIAAGAASESAQQARGAQQREEDGMLQGQQAAGCEAEGQQGVSSPQPLGMQNARQSLLAEAEGEDDADPCTHEQLQGRGPPPPRPPQQQWPDQATAAEAAMLASPCPNLAANEEGMAAAAAGMANASEAADAQAPKPPAGKGRQRGGKERDPKKSAAPQKRPAGARRARGVKAGPGSAPEVDPIQEPDQLTLPSLPGAAGTAAPGDTQAAADGASARTGSGRRPAAGSAPGAAAGRHGQHLEGGGGGGATGSRRQCADKDADKDADRDADRGTAVPPRARAGKRPPTQPAMTPAAKRGKAVDDGVIREADGVTWPMLLPCMAATPVLAAPAAPAPGAATAIKFARLGSASRGRFAAMTASPPPRMPVAGGGSGVPAAAAQAPGVRGEVWTSGAAAQSASQLDSPLRLAQCTPRGSQDQGQPEVGVQAAKAVKPAGGQPVAGVRSAVSGAPAGAKGGVCGSVPGALLAARAASVEPKEAAAGGVDAGWRQRGDSVRTGQREAGLVRGEAAQTAAGAARGKAGAARRARRPGAPPAAAARRKGRSGGRARPAAAARHPPLASPGQSQGAEEADPYLMPGDSGVEECPPARAAAAVAAAPDAGGRGCRKSKLQAMNALQELQAVSPLDSNEEGQADPLTLSPVYRPPKARQNPQQRREQPRRPEAAGAAAAPANAAEPPLPAPEGSGATTDNLAGDQVPCAPRPGARLELPSLAMPSAAVEAAATRPKGAGRAAAAAAAAHAAAVQACDWELPEAGEEAGGSSPLAASPNLGGPGAAADAPHAEQGTHDEGVMGPALVGGAHAGSNARDRTPPELLVNTAQVTKKLAFSTGGAHASPTTQLLPGRLQLPKMLLAAAAPPAACGDPLAAPRRAGGSSSGGSDAAALSPEPIQEVPLPAAGALRRGAAAGACSRPRALGGVPALVLGGARGCGLPGVGKLGAAGKRPRTAARLASATAATGALLGDGDMSDGDGTASDCEGVGLAPCGRRGAGAGLREGARRGGGGGGDAAVLAGLLGRALRDDDDDDEDGDGGGDSVALLQAACMRLVSARAAAAKRNEAAILQEVQAAIERRSQAVKGELEAAVRAAAQQASTRLAKLTAVLDGKASDMEALQREYEAVMAGKWEEYAEAYEQLEAARDEAAAAAAGLRLNAKRQVAALKQGSGELLEAARAKLAKMHSGSGRLPAMARVLQEMLG